MTIQALYPLTQPSLNLDFANTKRLDPRITFTRASSARFYDGKTTAKAEENLLTFSQEFDNAAWGPAGTTVLANTSVAPDGTTTAETLTATVGSSGHLVSQQATLVTGAIYVASFFVKAGTHNYVQIATGAQNIYANFDITAGAGVLGTSSGMTASITSVGNNWYRCVALFTQSTANSVYIALASTASDLRVSVTPWTAAGTETVFIWGAQLEQRSSVTAYTVTTAQPITNYIPVLQTALDNVARFDHNPVTGESLGLFVEEQRSNLLTYSDDFSNASWTKVNSSITANILVAPDGTLTGDLFIPNTGVTTATVDSATVLQAKNGTYTASVYMKFAGFVFASIRVSAFSGNVINAFINLTTGETAIRNDGAASGATASAQSVGNGWWRVSVSGIPKVGDATTGVSLVVSPASGLSSATFPAADGYSGIYIWGAQLEAGAFATSYIPTVASQVTRSADAASMTGVNFSSWYNQGEGTVYSEFRPIGITTANRLFSIDDGTSSIQSRPNTSTTWEITASVTPAVYIADSYTSNVLNKMALGMKFNDYGCVFNATPEVADTSAGVLVGANRLSIGCHLASAGQLNGHIKKLSYYPLRLPAAQLQELTA